MDFDSIIQWLMEGDPSIQFQTKRDLLGHTAPPLQSRISRMGWGRALLNAQNQDSHWGNGYYNPKWTSTHYTLLDLKNFCIAPGLKAIHKPIHAVLKTGKGYDGGINPAATVANSDVCINGMFLNIAAYFGAREPELFSIVDFLLSQHMADGGYNCRSNRSPCKHSSFHSTLSVLEGIEEYSKNGYTYRLNELQKSASQSQSFLLEHKLFRSHRTGHIVDKKMLMLSYPSRWRYDILRVLDYFHSAKIPYDPRMQDAIDILFKKRKKNGTWPVQAKHPGAVHIEMEKTGAASRWNTLRAIRVLQWLSPNWLKPKD